MAVKLILFFKTNLYNVYIFFLIFTLQLGSVEGGKKQIL